MPRTRIAVMSAILIIGLVAGYLTFRAVQSFSSSAVAAVQRVPPGDHEIAWIDAATSGSGWERFVSGIHHVARAIPGVVVEDAKAFPQPSTAIPEVALSVAGKQGKLWIRWYKLTSEAGIEQWVSKLCGRTPPPLAIVGGGSSDRARELSQALSEQNPLSASSPLLLITTATADKVRYDEESEQQGLLEIYARRSFRFCFTNSQMAAAVIDFIWSREDLRPDAGPVYQIFWRDDPYSEDLAERFYAAFTGRRTAEQWLPLLSQTAMGSLTGGFALLTPQSADVASVNSFSLPYSVGSLDQPNAREMGVGDKLMETIQQHPDQRQALLLLPASSQPARRFLRGLARIASPDAPRIIAATGDAIDFNTIYRDRHTAWPVQDLPFHLVIFCHRNPVDDSVSLVGMDPTSSRQERAVSGTQDLLLYSDIIQALLEASFKGTRLVNNADELAQGLRSARPARFDPDGNRRGGTGEHVVLLSPRIENGRVLPSALLEVWSSEQPQGGGWKQIKSIALDEQVSPAAGGP